MASPNNGSLVIGSTGVASFVQQGDVDWVAFGNTTWTASAEVLQRFALADVQPITFGAGIALAAEIELSPLGQQRMEDAIARLHGVPLLQDMLWLGFDDRSLVHAMVNTARGMECVALCSALVHVHSDSFAARILAELWKESDYPDEYEPSHSQFLSLVKLCAGVLVKTPFMATVDLMLGEMIRRGPDGTEDEIPVSSEVQDIARALRGLFQLSRGKVDSITVTGGLECALFASLAHWLFELYIEVIDEEDNLIFRSTPENASTQLYVRYGRVCNDAIHTPSTTYFLRYVRDDDEDGDGHFVVRTPWDGCLRRTFGAAFQTFTELPHLVGAYLGSLARIYAALAQAEPEVDTLSRDFYVDFVEASFGHGFIATVMKTFPELDRVDGLQQSMEAAAEKSFADAVRTVEPSVQDLETLCQCYGCSEETGQSSTKPDLTGICLAGIAYAIREIARTMASVVHDSQDERPLLPMIEGIKRFSCHQKGARVSSVRVPPGADMTVQRNDKAIFIEFALGLCEAGGRVSPRLHPLYNVSLLFQGPSNWQLDLSPTHMVCTAIYDRGVSCYVDVLRSLTCQAELLRLVHIVPGHISYKGRHYRTVRDYQRRGTSAAEVAQVTPASIAIQESDLTRLENQPMHMEIRATVEDQMKM